MKLKALVLVLVLFVTILSSNAQEYFPNKEKFNGKYYTMKPIKINGTDMPKIYQVTCEVNKMGDKKVLAVSKTKGDFPAVYTFKPEWSKTIKKAVFFNPYGLMSIEYDKNSFVLVGVKAVNSYVDFYSKNRATVKGMTEKKALAYAKKHLKTLKIE